MNLAEATTSAEPTGFTGWVVGVMEALGGPGAGLIIALENVFPPLPSELILPLAGFTASQGGMGLISAIFWTTLGSLVGALALYGVGAGLGRDRTYALAARIPLVKLSDIDRTEAWFVKHGTKAVFFGRMLPLFRSFISIPAGVERMPIGAFALLTTVGSLFWNTGFVVAGYLLGQNWHLVEQYAGVFSKAVLATVVVALGYFVLVRVRANRRAAHAEAPTELIGQVDSDDAPTELIGRISSDDAPTERFERLR
ncbi:DedA family protein [Parasphingorhabdus pacifica]